MAEAGRIPSQVNQQMLCINFKCTFSLYTCTLSKYSKYIHNGLTSSTVIVIELDGVLFLPCQAKSLESWSL